MEVGTGQEAVAVITGHDEPHVSRAGAAGSEVMFHKPVEWDRVVEYLRRVKSAAANARRLRAS